MNTNALIEQQLGIPVQKSSVYTAKTLLRQCYRGKEHIIRDTSFDLRDLPFYQSAFDIVFRRPLGASMIGMTVHLYDKNSAYLSACSSTDTGIADPIHLADGDDGTHIVPGLPGIYRVSWGVFSPESYDTALTPSIIDEKQEWITNDVLLYAQSKGYEVTIHEAWVFPEYDRILGNRDAKRNYAKKIWDARQALKDVDEEAYAKMKEIALVGVGSFATSKEKYPGLNLIHPNWWADVVGKTRVNMLANIEKYAAVAGTPILVYCDGVWFVSRDPNPRTAVPGILDRQDKLGGYKHVYSFTLTQELYDQAKGLSEGELVSLFHKAGKHHEK